MEKEPLPGDDSSTTEEDRNAESTTSSTALPNLKKEEPTRKRLWQTTVRESLLPLLPPPVTRGVHSLDAALSAHVGPEPTITLSVTMLVAWLVIALLQRGLSRRSGRAIKTVDDDPLRTAASREERWDATVLLIGARNAGKTRLFYQICHGEPNMPTVASLKPNVGTLSSRIRVLDWPGHAPLSEALATLPSKGAPWRVVLVVDATQSVAAAADLLYQLLEKYGQDEAMRSHRSTAPRIPVLVACHKKDLPKAKNDKRIKIQLRTELERLLLQANHPSWWPAHQSVDLDELPVPLQLHLIATSCQDAAGSEEILEFCRTGTLSSVVTSS